jgi:hypothetical protein
VRAVPALLLCWPLAVFAVDRDLDDCTVGSTPTALAPLDLDACTINDGDDITGILTGLATTYDDVYVKAPSESIGVTFTGTVQFGPSGQGADEFKFFEDEAHTLVITHVPVTADAQMWLLTNLDAITIGGPGLRMTFKGTHPGLGTGNPCSGTKESCSLYDSFGLIAVSLTDNSNPALLDFRANVWNSWGHGILVLGGDNGGDGEATANRWQAANFAGLFLNSAIYVNTGVMDVWVDPDRTVVMDPFNRLLGWDGGVALTASGGVPIGCSDSARAMWGSPVGVQIQYPRRVSGGVTAEYGMPVMNIFVPKYIGNSESDPYIIRVKDFGASGPTSITGLTAGVLTKLLGISTGVIKHDPAFPYSFTAADQRWLRIQELPPSYRSGAYLWSIASGCAGGNGTDNNYSTGSPFVWRAEASRDGGTTQYETAYIHVDFAGFDTAWHHMGDDREYVQAAGSGHDNAPGDTDPDRTWGHVVRIASGDTMPGITTMLDSITATGPGSWNILSIARKPIDQGGYLNPVDNTVTDTRVSGIVEIGQDATGTVIDNVEFTGAARAVITIGASSAVTVTDLCVPNGSTITGTGTLTYEGSSQSLPYTIPNGTANCTITADPRPGPVTGGGVN